MMSLSSYVVNVKQVLKGRIRVASGGLPALVHLEFTMSIYSWVVK